MKYLDSKSIEQLPGRRVSPGDTFRFQCHPELACFNQCCRNLNLFIYPYDLLRLRRNLSITSDQFIERYVDVVLRDGHFFPEVLLRMAENDEKTCPYLTDKGCGVYADRPDTCRSFPIECGARYHADTKSTETLFFFRPPAFCLGRNESRQWTVKTWLQDQDAQTYHKMTQRWALIRRLFQSDPWGPDGVDGAKGKMAFMAAYNIDAFREFVFGSSLLKRCKIKSSLIKQIRNSDTQLLLFGFEWIGVFVWGMPSRVIRF